MENGVHARLTELERRIDRVEDRQERGMQAVEQLDALRSNMDRFEKAVTASLDSNRSVMWRVGGAIVAAAVLSNLADWI